MELNRTELKQLLKGGNKSKQQRTNWEPVKYDKNSKYITEKA